VANKAVNRRWLTFRFVKLVSFKHGVWFANVNSVDLPTRLPQAFGTFSARSRIAKNNATISTPQARFLATGFDNLNCTMWAWPRSVGR